MVITGAAVASAALFLAIALRQNHLSTPSPNSEANRQPAPEIAKPTPGAPAFAASGKNVASPPSRVAVARDSTSPERPVRAKFTLEVLVPHDDEVALASYAQQWSSRKRVPLLANDANPATVALLEVAPIQIPELDVKPLAEGDSQ